MKQSLQLRLGQQITMTPQLQQAIRLLQLSTLELQLEVQQALESNIMLESAEDDQLDDDELDNLEKSLDSKVEDFIDPAMVDIPHNDNDIEDLAPSNNSDDIGLDSITEIPEELTVDSEWEDTFSNSDYPTNNNDYDGKDLGNQGSTQESLQSHLLWQLDLTPFSDIDRAIATAIIDAIDNDGYLRVSLEEVQQSVSNNPAGADDIEIDINAPMIEIDEIEAVLHRIQHFDPVGVGARNLSECLLLQLAEYDPTTPFLEGARQLVRDHLEILAVHDYTQLSKRMKLSREDLKQVVDLIQSLNPRPGSHLESANPTYVVPDVFVKKVKGQWKVELNADISPKLRINAHYASLLTRADNNLDVTSLKNHLQEARWFIKSLKSRHETLLKVASCIVKCQSGFLDYGDEAMKPLVLHDIASELDMHESTISRVTTHKYIHTPRGIFELKYFFSSHVGTNGGGECSSTAIRALIKKLVAAESTAKPLSDSKIAKLLSERGIKVARRTVAKYREAMVIPPSNERKRC